MLKRPDITPLEIIQLLQGSTELPEKVGSNSTYAERVEEREHLTEVLKNPNNARTMCIGCEADVALLETEACMCGGFVCKNCQRIEGFDSCEHEIEVLGMD